MWGALFVFMGGGLSLAVETQHIASQSTETQNLASLQCNATRQKCNASQQCIPINTINPFFYVMDVIIVFKIHLLCLTINSKEPIVYLPPVHNGMIMRVANIS